LIRGEDPAAFLPTGKENGISESQSQTGDVVVLESGGPRKTVERFENGRIVCE